MSDESTPEEERRPSEREQLIARVSAADLTLRETIKQLQRDLLRMDEIGCAVSRSRTRIDKVDSARVDWWAHFDYDILKGMTAGTKDQRARAERYELS